jgi:hypothetical protein
MICINIIEICWTCLLLSSSSRQLRIRKCLSWSCCINIRWLLNWCWC